MNRRNILFRKVVMNKLKAFINRLKYIWNIADTIKEYNKIVAREINNLEKKINERTTVHADINYKGDGSQIIVIGRYRNKDYVRAFTVRQENLSSIVDMLRTEEKYAKVGRFDMVGGMDFSVVYDRDEF